MAYISKYSGEEIDSGINQIPQINTNVDDLQSQINELKSSLTATILNTIYPIGSLYTSFEATNPATLIGGTWEQIKDTFLLAAGDTYAIGISGGEATHTLTVDEIPSHRHNFDKISWGGSQPSNYGSSGYLLAYQNPLTYPVSNEYFNTTGGDASHNNMPPYQTIYMWKRIS